MTREEINSFMDGLPDDLSPTELMVEGMRYAGVFIFEPPEE